jgi:hypothetical protein
MWPQKGAGGTRGGMRGQICKLRGASNGRRHGQADETCLGLPQHRFGCVRLPHLQHLQHHLRVSRRWPYERWAGVCRATTTWSVGDRARSGLLGAMLQRTCSYSSSSLANGSFSCDTWGSTASQRPLLMSDTKFSMLSTVLMDTWHSFWRAGRQCHWTSQSACNQASHLYRVEGVHQPLLLAELQYYFDDTARARR